VSQTTTQLDTLCINTIRCLAADAVEKAKSGHPGAPMGMAPMAYVLWTKFLKHNPVDPSWPDRDRFVLSAGHASMLLYGLLHLTGYGVSLDDIKNFRQWGSQTPGHPEFGHTPGVETTTGPLGQGFATAVGMAMAERFMSARFNRPEAPLVDHYTYVICGDGDLMEGISYEAASLAGHHKLGKLICLYDDNQITIDGGTNLAFTEDVAKRFEAMGWQVQRVANGDEDLPAIESAIRHAQAEKNKPSIIITRTTIGYGAPNKKNSHNCHGSPLGAEEVKLAKQTLDWPQEQAFYIPDEAREEFARAPYKGREAQDRWQKLKTAYAAKYPAEAQEFDAWLSRKKPQDWKKSLTAFKPEDGAMATRAASSKVLNSAAAVLPNLLSGSADLSESVNTTIKGGGSFSLQTPAGRNIHYGVREHAMGAIANGMTLHGGPIIACGTFLIFSDYMKSSIRLAALMKIPTTFLFSHDSIGVGEDGPTHQPIEQLAGLRAIPNLTVLRPADANETRASWITALERVAGPCAIILTRQNIPFLSGAASQSEGVSRGAYILEKESKPSPEIILMGTGSEVHLLVAARKILEERGIATRVVSMPSWELFRAQDAAYRQSVLPREITKRLAVEAASPQGWHEWVGSDGVIIGMTDFGASAPSPVALDKFGFNPQNVLDHALKLLSHA
jgi:transketolase